MELDLNLIGNFLIAIFFYNIIIKALAGSVMKWILKNDATKEVKQTFREKLKKKLEDE